MVKGLKLVVVAASLCAISSSYAIQSAASGMYLEGNVGYAKINESVKGGSTETDTGVSWGMNAGYKFMANFAAEIGFSSYPDVKFNLWGQKINGTENYTIDFALKGIVPINESGFDLFGKAGLAHAHHKIESKYITLVNSGDNSAMVGFLGAGLSYAINEHLSLVGQGNFTTKSGDKIPGMFQLTGGIAYTF